MPQIVVAAPGVHLQASRSVVWLLMVAAALAVAPHWLRLSPMVWLLGAIALIWRSFMLLGRAPAPGAWSKAVLVLATTVGVALTAKHIVALETAVSLLVVAFQLKLLESARQRDAFLVVMLGYFVTGTMFLFDQTLAISGYALVVVLLFTAVLVAQTQGVTAPRWRPAVLEATRLLAFALPMAVLLFLFFPRVSPLWSVPMPGAARTGLTDTLTPQQITALSRSAELAFRASFDGELPRPGEQYWRAIVYYEFDHGSWRAGALMPRVRVDDQLAWAPARPPWSGIGATMHSYEIVMEPTGQRWMFGLGISEVSENGLGVLRDGRIVSREPIHTQRAYRAQQIDQPDLQLPQWMNERALALPAGGDSQSRRLAASWRNTSNDRGADNVNVEVIVQQALRYFRDQNFVYTLTPDAVSEPDSIDGFLFGTRRGFCAHFAGSFVFLMRAAGVPARLIGGYQGGEVNALGAFITVRQYDAHAWAEVWYPDQGWQRVDPTAAVAPERVERGVEAMASGANALNYPWGIRQLTGLSTLFAAMDSIEHYWTLSVIGYDARMQRQMLEEWLGTTSWRTQVQVLMVGLAAVFGLLTALTLLRALRVQYNERGWLQALDRFGSRAGLERAHQESLAQYAQRLCVHAPEHAIIIRRFADQATEYLYLPANAAHARRLRSAVKRVAWQLRLLRWLGVVQSRTGD